MSDNHASFGGEIRLGTGQIAQLQPGGTINVVSHDKVPEHHFCMAVAHRRDFETPVTQVWSTTYDALVDFLKQLEALDYLLVSIERIDGIIPTR
jgi:hypothetical protein